MIFNKIKKTHEDLETFVIKLDKDGSSKFAKRWGVRQFARFLTFWLRTTTVQICETEGIS
jgi:hypothetical protein